MAVRPRTIPRYGRILCKRSPGMSEDMFAEQRRRTLGQIAASSVILPTLDFRPTLTLMCVADDYVDLQDTWADEDPKPLDLEDGGHFVRLNALSTAGHCIEPLIDYQVHSLFKEAANDPRTGPGSSR
ncbi:uncharacterized protein BYT42DRAFT_544893 [Radiomyces spectabilis]|uniref:uncharacterized protein n=1 Tax=Radiomyces spectabilis TaxID=64574 RepID=UPI00221F1F18|nr:uncharacterized protein BYT42DRAFT_544893 [Radiomyces spectabilis]KAI8380922.1 hypothetical protein BYT42DRAFT_544893 [Radiomyces spectabilis]